ncbi:MAG: hypothetical protein ACOC92_01315 [bacterium]
MGRRNGITMGTVKTAISLDEDLLRRVDSVARELGEPRSRVLARAAEQFLRRRQNQEILEQLNRAYGDDGGDDRDQRERELRRQRHRELVEGEW